MKPEPRDDPRLLPRRQMTLGAMSMEHEPGCKGWHTADLSCADATSHRAEHLANPWICWHSPHGYHGWVSADPADDEVCRYEGCERGYGDLPRAGESTERVDYDPD